MKSSAGAAGGGGGGAPARHKRRAWMVLMPLAVGLVFVAEIALLGTVDLASKFDVVETWTSSFSYRRSSLSSSDVAFDLPSSSLVSDGGEDNKEELECEEWLEKEDEVPYSRNFDKDPVLVAGAVKDWSSCSVNCEFGYGDDGRVPDAAFGVPQDRDPPSILRSMESSHYYSENSIQAARKRGYKIVMTTSLSSDVPVGYFSWAEYDIMEPLQLKTEKALAAAFISNCAARNFRLKALEALEQSGVTIDSYGNCHRNRDGRLVDKVDALRHYKFSLAFENSNEEDYVTEKFFQSLVAGSVPVVVGAPNIEDFAPSAGSILHIKELSDATSIADTMKQLASDPEAYNRTLQWKYKGPSDSFKALIDMAAVHSSCRLCIHLATKIHEEEERAPGFKHRPCSCSRNGRTVYHLFVRERGRFKMESIYLRSGNLTLKSLESVILAKFSSLNHVPVWKSERPHVLRGDNRNNLKIYRVYPVGITQRQALYTFKFGSNAELEKHITNHPCAKLEVIFV